MRAAFKLCSSHSATGPRIDDTLYDLSPEVFLKVVRETRHAAHGGEELSICVAKYCRGPYADDVDAKLLSALTARITRRGGPTVAYARARWPRSISRRSRRARRSSARCIAACAERWERGAPAEARARRSAVAAPVEPSKAKRRRAAERRMPLGRVVPDAIQIKILERALVDAAGSGRRRTKRSAALKRRSRWSSSSSRRRTPSGSSERFKRVPHTFRRTACTIRTWPRRRLRRPYRGVRRGSLAVLRGGAADVSEVRRTAGRILSSLASSPVSGLRSALRSWVYRRRPAVKRAMFYFE